MTEKEREEMWRIIEKILESLDRLMESQKEDREKARLFELHEKNEKEIVELRKIQNGTWQNYTEYAARKYGLRLIQPAFKPPIRRIKGEDFEIDGIAVVIETKTKPTRKAIKQLESNV